MGLKKYLGKRNFKKTPEPKEKKAKPLKRGLRFVIHKHAARRLHFDLRLEYRGVLLSWAVPKQPPRVKKLKRLAIQVEDHPLSYADFEGIIPEGEYGAGKVEIWDEGNYWARGAETKAESEKRMRQGFRKGHIAIVLSGKKVKGNYDLILFKRGGSKKMWLLMKT